MNKLKIVKSLLLKLIVLSLPLAFLSSAVSYANSLPRFVDVGAEDCVPCTLMAPALEQLIQEYSGKMEVVFIDAWKYPEQAKVYNVDLIPVQIFYDPSGKELYRRFGYISKEDILAVWSELGYKF